MTQPREDEAPEVETPGSPSASDNRSDEEGDDLDVAEDKDDTSGHKAPAI